MPVELNMDARMNMGVWMNIYTVAQDKRPN